MKEHGCPPPPLTHYRNYSSYLAPYHPIPPWPPLSTFIGFLLTVKTNQSVSRLLEGRLAWGRTILLTRDTSNLLSEYVYRVNEDHGLLAIRHLSIFGYLLKSRLREEVSEFIFNFVC